MIYLINNDHDFLINKEINKIIKENNIDDYNINTYSMLNDKLENIVEDFQTYSMFDDLKIVIVLDAYLFTSKKGETDASILENYLGDVNNSTIVIFVVKDKLDERKKLVKKVREIGNIIEGLEPNYNIIAKDFFKEYKISDELIELLIKRVGKDIYNLEQEIIKIKTFKGNDLLITKEDILNLSIKNEENDMFKLIDNIINKNKTEAIASFRQLTENNEEPIVIIVALANKLRMMYQIKEFIKKGYSEKDISSILKIKPGYLYYMRKTISKYDTSNIISLLESLADLDYEIKTGTINKYQAFELFLLNLK